MAMPIMVAVEEGKEKWQLCNIDMTGERRDNECGHGSIL